MSRFLKTLALFSAFLLLGACANTGAASSPQPSASMEASSSQTAAETPASQAAAEPDSEALKASGLFSDFDLETGYDNSAPVITLTGDTAETGAESVLVEGPIITIQKAGTYVIKGSLADGQIIVNVDDAEKVHLVLDGASVTCKNSAPLWIQSANKVVLTLAEGSQNTFADDDQSAIGAKSDDPNACVFSMADLTINGAGSLTVTGSLNNGIGTKDDLTVVSGLLSVTAADNALKGNDSVVIGGGTLTLKSAGGDGIKADTADAEGKGFVTVLGGAVGIDASDDGIQAATDLTVSGGLVTVTCGDDPTVCGGTASISENCLIKK